MSESPLLVIKGDASEEEVAALVAVLQGMATTAASAAASEQPATKTVWAAPARVVRSAHHAGPGGWRASALPR